VIAGRISSGANAAIDDKYPDLPAKWNFRFVSFIEIQ
jgi:hypothetical protein